MMKIKNKVILKYLICTFFSIYLLSLCCVSASALEDNTQNIIETESVDAAKRAGELLSENTPANIWNDFVDKLRDSFFSFSKKFSVLIFITFMLGVINVMCDNTAAVYAGEICLCSFAFSLVAVLCENLLSVMNTLNTFMLSMLPVMTTLYTSSVGVATATMSSSTTVMMLNICSTVFSVLLMPSVKAIVVFAAVTLISRSFDFSGIAKCIKSIVVWMFGIVMCVMSAVVFFQSVISVSKDGLASRTVRYAAQSLIPVIGSVVSESARTLAESMKLVRAVSGVSGIFAIIGVIASPVAALIVSKVFIGLCSALSKLLGCVKASVFYEEINGALNLLLGACIGVCIVFILILGIFAKSSIPV